MSRSDRERQRARLQAAGLSQEGTRRGGPPPPPARYLVDEPEPTIREQLTEASPAALGLLLVRLFFGATFLYAGIDKLFDPSFFDASAPTSIVAQLDAFTQSSPLAPLIAVMAPFAIPLGLLIALGEIAIGIGTLTGLAFRAAAIGGAGLSLLFWLTASWSTTPYFYGPDLPYAIGWVALAIAGHGGLLVPSFVRRVGEPRPGIDVDPGVAATRRLLLQAGTIGIASLVVASLTVPFRGLLGTPAGGRTGRIGGTGSTGGTSPTSGTGGTAPGATPTPTPAAGATGAFTPSGLTLTTTSAVDAKGAVRIRIPTDAPSSLPAGDPAIIVKLQDGTYAAFDAICTHEGCKVGWDSRDGVMLCPCHGAAFDPNDHGAVLAGPTRQPLPELALDIDPKTGAITLRA